MNSNIRHLWRLSRVIFFNTPIRTPACTKQNGGEKPKPVTALYDRSGIAPMSYLPCLESKRWEWWAEAGAEY